MDEYAMWIGYAVMVGLAGVGAFALIGAACQALWRRLLKEVPNMLYIQAAVSHYKTVVPPGDWADKRDA